MVNVDELQRQYRQQVAKYPNAPEGYAAQWSALGDLLLQHGGTLVVPPFAPDPYLGALLTGHLFTDSSITAPGWSGSSHANSTDLWIYGVAHTIATGYAMGSDGFWRRHTWALTGDGTGQMLLETTTVRELYFGIELTGADALAFARASDPDTLDEVLATGYTLRTIHLWSAMGPTAPSDTPARADVGAGSAIALPSAH